MRQSLGCKMLALNPTVCHLLHLIFLREILRTELHESHQNKKLNPVGKYVGGWDVTALTLMLW